jgi:two-component system cell cycle sensor histidine kinase/response regulator CckA
MAWREGRGETPEIVRGERRIAATAVRSGRGEDHLVWRFRTVAVADPVRDMLAMVEGKLGERLGSVGVMAALLDRDGKVLGGNRALFGRAVRPGEPDARGRVLTDLLRRGGDDRIRFAVEDDEADALRMIQVPVEPEQEVSLFLLLDDIAGGRGGDGGGASAASIHNLLAMLPAGAGAGRA